LWELVASHAVLFKRLFCQTYTTLPKDIVDRLCQVVFSEQGSNARAKDEETIYSWEVLLQDIHIIIMRIYLGKYIVFDLLYGCLFVYP